MLVQQELCELAMSLGPHVVCYVLSRVLQERSASWVLRFKETSTFLGVCIYIFYSLTLAVVVNMISSLSRNLCSKYMCTHRLSI